MTYAEAVQFLYSLRLFGLKLGLENTFKLAAQAGNPQEQLRFIHVAGTNGKGSTCAMLESIYRAAGFRVGLFTSPHLVSFRERIQVNRELISEPAVVRLVGDLRGQRNSGLQPGNHGAGFQPAHPGAAVSPDSLVHAGHEAAPTFFEFVTVMALRYFAEKHCDLVIWETGMGGRLDATNIVTPLASVITNIQLDHQQWLGYTLAEIAAEKSGIIKPGVPVITAADSPEALHVIERTAREKNAPLVRVDSASGQSLSPRIPALPLLGDHQLLNASLALATVDAVRDSIPVTEEAIRLGLETVQWPGRLQSVRTSSGGTILLDGAHNPAGAAALRAVLQKSFPDARPTLVLGMLEDKDWARVCQLLAPLSRRVLLAPVPNERTAPPERLREACLKSAPSAQVAACSSLGDALKLTANDPLIVITGSLYLVGEALELLGLAPAAPSERGLNEWTLKK